MSYANETTNTSHLNKNAKLIELRHFYYSFKQSCLEKKALLLLKRSKTDSIEHLAIDEEIRQLDKLIAIDEELYVKVLTEYNISRMDMLIYKNIPYNVADCVGTIRIVVRTFKTDLKRVDWFSSQRVRNSIINAGRVPYNKDTNPDGERFLVYYTSTEEPYFVWYKPSQTDNKRANNLNLYKFKPSVRSACVKLFNFRNDNPNNITLYKGNKLL